MKISFIFFKRKVFLMFWKTETPKKIIYISGNGNLEKNSLHFRKRNFFIFWEMELYRSINFSKNSLG